MLFGFFDLERRNRLQIPHMDIPAQRVKRSHREVDDCDECLPISKRINRLHIEAQRKRQGEGRQMNGHPAGSNPQPSTSWQSSLQQSPEIAGAQCPNGIDLSQSFSQPYYSADPSSLSSSCNSCGILPQGTQCPHIAFMSSAAVHQALPQHHPANIPAQNQYSYAAGAMALPQGYPVPGNAGEILTQQNFVPIGARESSVDPSPEHGGPVSSLVPYDEFYDPELSASENPYYFHINEVLFNAHCERIRRSSNQSSDTSL